jgi:hypothetical protein
MAADDSFLFFSSTHVQNIEDVFVFFFFIDFLIRSKTNHSKIFSLVQKLYQKEKGMILCFFVFFHPSQTQNTKEKTVSKIHCLFVVVCCGWHLFVLFVVVVGKERERKHLEKRGENVLGSVSICHFFFLRSCPPYLENTNIRLEGHDDLSPPF